jgi:hypothetical protein
MEKMTRERKMKARSRPGKMTGRWLTEKWARKYPGIEGSTGVQRIMV